jgi:hypothetical protein
MIEPINVNTYRPGQDRDTAEKINEIIDYINRQEQAKPDQGQAAKECLKSN